MTTRPAMPPDFLDCDPGLGDDDSFDENVPTHWDVLARWHREDGFVVDGIPPTVTRNPRGGAAPNDDFDARRQTRDERHRRRGWTLSLRDGGPPPGVRATVCTLAWTTASWHRFSPNRASHSVITARREETGRGTPAEASDSLGIEVRQIESIATTTERVAAQPSRERWPAAPTTRRRT